MNPHLFLFQTKSWLGEGKISFAASKETVRFFTRWRLVDKTDAMMMWLQEVELHGLDQTNRNFFTFTDISNDHFKILMDNEFMGKTSGKGVITSTTIAWEIGDDTHKTGYEVYELKNNQYSFRAEYHSNDPFRTLIEGNIWEKNG